MDVTGRFTKENGVSCDAIYLHFLPLNVLFSNQFLEDLDKIWELRKYIPNPKELKYTIGNKQDLVKNKE